MSTTQALSNRTAVSGFALAVIDFILNLRPRNTVFRAFVMTILSLGPEAGAEGPHDNTWQGAVPSSAILFFFSLEKEKKSSQRTQRKPE